MEVFGAVRNETLAIHKREIKLMVKTFFKYLGYFGMFAGSAGLIYGIGVFFANLQNDIDTVIIEINKIQIEVNKIEPMRVDIGIIRKEQLIQGEYINLLDGSLVNHYKQDKSQIDELIKYYESKDEVKKK